MNANQFSIYIEATANKDTVTKNLAWGFTSGTAYSGCEGTAIIDGGAGASILTIHADHLFYDDLTSEEPSVRFDLVAGADGNADDNVTMEELAAVDITGLANYGVGSNEVTELRTFVEFQTGTVGHIDGEGHCPNAIRL